MPPTWWEFAYDHVWLKNRAWPAVVKYLILIAAYNCRANYWSFTFLLSCESWFKSCEHRSRRLNHNFKSLESEKGGLMLMMVVLMIIITIMMTMLKMILKNYKWSNFPEKNCEKKTLSAKNAFKAWRWNANSFLILFYQNGLIPLKGLYVSGKLVLTPTFPSGN